MALLAFDIVVVIDDKRDPPHFLAFLAVSVAPFFASSKDIFFAKSIAISVCFFKTRFASFNSKPPPELFDLTSEESTKVACQGGEYSSPPSSLLYWPLLVLELFLLADEVDVELLLKLFCLLELFEFVPK